MTNFDEVDFSERRSEEVMFVPQFYDDSETGWNCHQKVWTASENIMTHIFRSVN